MRFSNLKGFEWDSGNLGKVSSRVSVELVEEAFFSPSIVMPDTDHSSAEEDRSILICLSLDRPLFCVFTIRNGWVRVISARYMHAKEVKKYERS